MIPTARMERAQFHRARSASKEGTWPLPTYPSEARALREQMDRPSYPRPFFSILLSDTVPGRSYRHIRIEGQANFSRPSPSKDACAKNADLIQHH